MGPGDLVDGRFEVRQRVAAGGMGVVYRAVDRASGSDVALKLLHVEDREVLARFAREARILAELAHPAIVRYITHGTTGGGAHYLAMEWLEGRDLASRLEQGPLAVPEAVALVAAIAEALAFAHDKGAVHRDIKPSNIFLPSGGAGQPKLLDFGVARLLADSVNLTRAGIPIGTPAYMSPEQVRGGAIDSRTDLFSLGCVLFECLAGHPPWSGDSIVAVMAKIMFDETPRLRSIRPEVPAALEGILDRLFEKDRASRYPSASALALELRRAPSADAPEADAEPRGSPSLTRSENRLVCVVLAESAGAARPGERPRALADTEVGAPDPLDRTVLARAPEVSQLVSLAEEHSARLEVLVGGSVVAVLSGAAAAVDLCARAASFALALAKALPRSRIALATGRAVVSGAVPTGEAIERAAALFASARSPGIRIDAATESLLDARFRIDRAGGSPVLIGEHRSLEPSRRLLGKPTPCVGRGRELAALSAAFDASIAERSAHAALLTGAAGTGKSRVRHELLSQLVTRCDLEVWIARGDPMRQGSPLGMLAQAIRHAAGIGLGEPPEESRDKLRARVAPARSPEDRARMAEFLGEIVGVPFPDHDSLELRAARQNPMLMADQMRRAWEELLLVACEARPVVLVLEDLQWGDLPTTKFVDAALRNVREVPFFVFALARPEVFGVFTGLWSERSVTRIELHELPPADAAELVRAILGAELPQATVARLVGAPAPSGPVSAPLRRGPSSPASSTTSS